MSRPAHPTTDSTEETAISTDELRQEHATDHAAQAPTQVTLDSSASTGPGYDADRKLPGAPAHGPGSAVPVQSRGERVTSFDVADFPSPTGREEDWRFTPVDSLRGLLEVPEATASLQVEVVAPAGASYAELPSETSGRGTAFVPGDRAAVVAYTSAPSTHVVRIDAEAELDEPVHVSLRGIGERADGHVVVDAGAHSKAIVVLDHSGTAAHAGNVEIRVGDGARLTVVSVQQWDDDAVHLGQHDALVGRDATFKHVAVTLGGKVVRLSTNVRYDGPGGDATLLGVYFADAGQHLEHRSFADHGAPHCKSNVVYKGALQGDTAHTVWVGDVLIRAAAEGTDTYELNRNLVLTDGARADSVPNLEIETGEIVGAGHASATGRFDDEQLFYLQSRGISEDVARRLVVRGFFADVVQQIGVPEVADRLMSAIEAELSLSMHSPGSLAPEGVPA